MIAHTKAIGLPTLHAELQVLLRVEDRKSLFVGIYCVLDIIDPDSGVMVRGSESSKGPLRLRKTHAIGFCVLQAHQMI